MTRVALQRSRPASPRRYMTLLGQQKSLSTQATRQHAVTAAASHCTCECAEQLRGAQGRRHQWSQGGRPHLPTTVRLASGCSCRHSGGRAPAPGPGMPTLMTRGPLAGGRSESLPSNSAPGSSSTGGSAGSAQPAAAPRPRSAPQAAPFACAATPTPPLAIRTSPGGGGAAGARRGGRESAVAPEPGYTQLSAAAALRRP